MRNIFTAISLFCSGLLWAQEPIRINLNANVEDDKLKKTQAIIPVYKYTNVNIEPYNNFGTESPKNTKWITLKNMPDMADCSDTAYSFIYFSGADNAANSGYLIALIGNYNRMSRKTVHFFIDKNNNLDFRDDGPPYLMPYQRDSIVVSLQNTKVEGSDYQVKLSRIMFGKSLDYKNLLDSHYRKHMGKKVFTRINNCYREQRYNLCSANFKSLTDSFAIGIKDMNVNALYNDYETDMIYIGPYNQPIVSEDLFEYRKGKNKTSFEWNEKLFNITNIDPLGKWIDIQEATKQKTYKKLKLHRKVPKISFVNEMSVKHSLKQFRKKHIYLYFFNDDLASLKEDTIYLRKLQNEFGNKIQVIGMNYGDEPKSMRFFQQYYNIPWIVGMSNREINKKFYVENLPKGFWIGKHRRLKGRNYTPKMMYEKALVKFGKK
ncbi:MAG: TlpA family protein disulfide reductase [Bacteroidia bacterium]